MSFKFLYSFVKSLDGDIWLSIDESGFLYEAAIPQTPFKKRSSDFSRLLLAKILETTECDYVKGRGQRALFSSHHELRKSGLAD